MKCFKNLKQKVVIVINIREVAKLAGVSPATVSRVINGTAKVSAEKRARVLEAISATDFVPNEVARSLYRKSAKLIGLIIPSITNPYFTQVASIIERLAEENGYRVFLCDVGDDVEDEQAAIQTLVSMNADGIIIAATNEAISGAGKTIMVVGFDATDDAIEAIKAGRMAATIAQQPDLIGKTAVENAVKLINGQGIAPSIPVEVTLITAANAG